MNYSINQTNIQYDVTGECTYGENAVLLQNAIDLTSKTFWTNTGFSIEKLFTDKLYQDFIEKTYLLLFQCWRKAGLSIPVSFEPDQYHTLVQSWEMHLLALEHTNLLSTSEFPLPIRLLEDLLTEICKENLQAKNPFDDQSVFHFRVIRPASRDNNPLHRDVWLNDYKDCINIYIPIAGSNELSSLILIPGSHHWPESKVERTIGGAEINGVKFNVPAVSSITGAFEAIRANPLQNEILVFSPYLIHGGAANLNTDKTRISIEMRLWKK